tara:strand:- start:81 stop:290 length:210 start_codon:yes stop_codon:yes gene_type:complete
MHIVIGYKSNTSSEGAETLYLGKDRGAALAELCKSQFPFVRKEVFSNTQPTQRKFHEVSKKPLKNKRSK